MNFSEIVLVGAVVLPILGFSSILVGIYLGRGGRPPGKSFGDPS